jgi:plastocyanin
MRFPLPGLAVLLLSPPVQAAAPRTHVVTIERMQFGAMPATARAGDRILWVNKDLVLHSATAGDGSFDLDVPAGARKAAVLKAGTIRVVCRYHPAMRAMLKVRPR